MTQVMTLGSVEIRVAERKLIVDGTPVALGARAFDVLLALAERSDRVVSKAELLDLGWPGIVVEENNLTVQISTLRRLLGHDAIVTVTGRGYRLALAGTGAARTDLQRPPPVPAPDVAAGRLERRLAAIVQADVVGWPRLVARDPMRAANTWRRIRQDLIERSVPRFGGRLIELTAERVQIEFGSVVEAVAWSLQLQVLLTEWRATPDAAESASVHMRIGIAVDDVIVDDGKLVGDGVNVAADLQHIAAHDEVLTTQKVRDFVMHKLDAVFDPRGERLMPRLQRPVQVFRIDAGSRAAVRGDAPRAPLARVASIAVLPFDASGAVGEAYFGDGFTEEIIATLSLNRALFVIAHSSTLRFRGNEVDLTAVADELGVRYLVIGGLRRSGAQVRLNVSLVYAPDQRVLWHERFDGSTDDLFGFQAEIAASVAAAVAPQVQDEEVARVRHRPTEHYGAYDCVLRALAGLYQLGSAEFDTAGDMLKHAIALDPGYAQAHAHLAWWYTLRVGEGLTSDRSEGALALEHAMRAVRLDGRDAWALSVAGYVTTLQERRYQQALEMYEQALAINPSCAAAWARSAATLSYMGRCDESMERVQRAMRLSPFDQHMFWHLTICGGACFVGRRYDEAAGWLGKALRLNPRFNGARRVQIAALVRIGELAEARELAQALLAETPDFSVAAFGRWSPMQQPYLDDLLQGLRHAGLPD
ncbi:tetratricopeptide repeat protein [Aquabacterium humicola]|uniref:tetratricopeptide repeat protein n=1 Tax=Aquabacterium humicola TaxID=3237377 RepID=UPI002542C192|nr:winged helix-turn-helix domain-containing protein [Rubrivivax pictus]